MTHTPYRAIGKKIYHEPQAMGSGAILCDTEEQAARIVACVNGCAGLSDADASIAATLIGVFRRMKEAQRQWRLDGLNPAAFKECVEAGRPIADCTDDEGKFFGHVPSAAEFLAFKQALAYAMGKEAA